MAPLEVLDLGEPQRHYLGVFARRMRLELKKTGFCLWVSSRSEESLAATQLESVPRVTCRDGFRKRLKRSFGLDRMLAQRKLVVQMQKGFSRAPAIAVGQRRVCETQPDRRRIDRIVLDQILIDFDSVVMVAHRLRGFCFTECGSLPDEPRRVLQLRKPCACRLESTEAKLGDSGVIRGMGQERRCRRRGRRESAQRLFVFLICIET